MKSSVAHFQARIRGALLLVLFLAVIFLAAALEHPNRAAAATSSCSSGQKCVYLPLVSSTIASDLAITGIEVTQGIQDPQNSVPLVAGRNTMLRIFTRATGYNHSISNVKVSVTASNGSFTLNGSPKAVSASVSLSSNRADMNSTINIPISSAWLQGAVNLTVRLDPDNAIAESDESNNVITRQLVFHAVPPLQVRIIPITYIDTTTNHTYASSHVDTISDWIMRTYPINQILITWGDPYVFKGDLRTSTDFSRLLSEVTALKSSEKGPAEQVYYGLIPTKDSSSSWFYGGIAGIGWIGARTSVGLDFSGSTSQIAAHEIGHNLGMGHTPCGLSGGTDPAFPYKDGSIGQFGMDVSTSKLYDPSLKDVMSYCDPKWISDYTYKEFYSSQVANGASPALMRSAVKAAGVQSTRGLLVRAQINADGISLLPAYVLPDEVTQLPEPGEYTVQLFGASDNLLSEVPVRAYAAEDETFSTAAINALLPLPDEAVTKMRLVKDGQLLAEHTLETQPADPAATAVPQNAQVTLAGSQAQVTWANSLAPVLLRYSTNDGQTWKSLGVDLEGGQLAVPDANHFSVSLTDPAVHFQVIPAWTWK